MYGSNGKISKNEKLKKLKTKVKKNQVKFDQNRLILKGFN